MLSWCESSVLLGLTTVHSFSRVRAPLYDCITLQHPFSCGGALGVCLWAVMCVSFAAYMFTPFCWIYSREWNYRAHSYPPQKCLLGALQNLLQAPPHAHETLRPHCRARAVAAVGPALAHLLGSPVLRAGQIKGLQLPVWNWFCSSCWLEITGSSCTRSNPVWAGAISEDAVGPPRAGAASVSPHGPAQGLVHGKMCGMDPSFLRCPGPEVLKTSAPQAVLACVRVLCVQ